MKNKDDIIYDKRQTNPGYTLDDREAMRKTTIYVRCCRLWAVTTLMPIGKCGICGEKPVRTGLI